MDEVEQILISGKKFKKLRKLLVLNQQEMAEELGMSVSGVRAIERKPASKIRDKAIRALANLRKISPTQQQAELAYDDTDPSERPKNVVPELISKLRSHANKLTMTEIEDIEAILKTAREAHSAPRLQWPQDTITSGR